MFDVWIYTTPAAWEAIKPAAEVTEELWHKPYREAEVVNGKVVAGRVVYNVIGYQEPIEALITVLDDPPSDWWEQGTGLNVVFPVEHRTDPDRILSYMEDHVTYDIDGNELSRTAPSLSNPNWGHVFAGQKCIVPGKGIKVLAGDFDPDTFDRKDFL